jgi:hypothetical protein
MMKPEPGAHDMMQTISDLPAPAVHQFGVIKEMLDAIETTTIAGQRYVMGKVVAFLHGEVGRGGARCSHGSTSWPARRSASFRTCVSSMDAPSSWSEP